LSEKKSIGVYLSATSTPLNTLAFLIPWLLLYEVGLVLSGDAGIRNLADQWVREALGQAGLTQQYLMPVLPCLILLGWHHTTKHPWRIAWHYFAGMLLECIAYAVLLFALFLGQRWFFAQSFAEWQPAVVEALEIGKGQIMLAMIGAGIYEELLFRLILLPAVIALFNFMGTKIKLSQIIGAVISSLLFAAAHSIHESQDAFTFVFRFAVGLVLSVIFLKRGFGIAVGTHSIYNVTVQLLVI